MIYNLPKQIRGPSKPNGRFGFSDKIWLQRSKYHVDSDMDQTCDIGEQWADSTLTEYYFQAFSHLTFKNAVWNGHKYWQLFEYEDQYFMIFTQIDKTLGIPL